MNSNCLSEPRMAVTRPLGLHSGKKYDLISHMWQWAAAPVGPERPEASDPEAHGVWKEGQTAEQSWAVEKPKPRPLLFKAGGRENMVVSAQNSIQRKPVPHTSQPYVLLLAAAQTPTVEPVPARAHKSHLSPDPGVPRVMAPGKGDFRWE